MKNTDLSNRIKSLRIVKGYAQERLAELSQLSLRTIQRIENGETEPHGDTLRRLALCLDSSVAELKAGTLVNDLPEDKRYLIIMQLSVLGFIVFPVLGIVIPMILWAIKKGSIKDVDHTGIRIIKAQSILCLIYLLAFVLMTASKIQHWGMPRIIGNILPFQMGLIGLFSLLIASLYVCNVWFAVINAYMTAKGKRRFLFSA